MYKLIILFSLFIISSVNYATSVAVDTFGTVEAAMTVSQIFGQQSFRLWQDS